MKIVKLEFEFNRSDVLTKIGSHFIRNERTDIWTCVMSQVQGKIWPGIGYKVVIPVKFWCQHNYFIYSRRFGK